MRRHLLALLVCVLLCLMVLPGTASADSGPKPAVTITVVNAPAGEYYLAEDEHQQYLDKNPDGYCPVHATGVTCG